MLKLLSLIAPRRVRDARPERPRGPLAQMLVCDVNNLDRLTRALAEHRL
jgi:hypothetical protein